MPKLPYSLNRIYTARIMEGTLHLSSFGKLYSSVELYKNLNTQKEKKKENLRNSFLLPIWQKQIFYSILSSQDCENLGRCPSRRHKTEHQSIGTNKDQAWFKLLHESYLVRDPWKPCSIGFQFSDKGQTSRLKASSVGFSGGYWVSFSTGYRGYRSSMDPSVSPFPSSSVRPVGT